jgi:hypothetical protein
MILILIIVIFVPMKYTSIFYLFTCLCLTLFSCKEPGCTDPNALNFDSDANEEDNSCLYNSNLNIEFRLLDGNQDFAKYDTIQNNDFSFRLENMKFYISDLQLKSSRGNINLADVHLYDIDDENTHNLTFEVEEGSYEGLNFGIGLNSEQNGTTPADYAVDHPLGLNKNTFWAMVPSSYIFVMIEGKMDTTLNGDFYPITYHLAHNDLLKNMDLNHSISISQNIESQVINVDLSEIFKDVDLSKELPHQSTVSPLAQLLIENFSASFEIE